MGQILLAQDTSALRIAQPKAFNLNTNERKFIDLLSKANVQTGKTLKHAEEIYKGRLKIKVLEETLPEAWNKLISEPRA